MEYIRLHEEGAKTDNDFALLMDNLEFEDSDKLLMSNTDMAHRYLYGKWANETGDKYMNFAEDGYYIRNLPWKDFMTDDAVGYWDMFDGQMFLWYEESVEKLLIHRLEVKDPNTVSVYCYGNAKTYEMHRQ